MSLYDLKIARLSVIPSTTPVTINVEEWGDAKKARGTRTVTDPLERATILHAAGSFVMYCTPEEIALLRRHQEVRAAMEASPLWGAW